MCGQTKLGDRETILLTLATDYIEVLQTRRTNRLLPGRVCVVSLVRKTAAASAGEPYYQDPGNLYVIVLAFVKGKWLRQTEELVGHGCGGTLLVGDFTRDGTDEIFFWTDGQVSESGIFQINGKTLRWLYRDKGNFHSTVRDIDGDGLSEVIEYCLTQDLDEPYYSRVARQGYVLAKRVWKWNRTKGVYVLWRVEPDVEGQKKLSREELLHVPGAKEILQRDRR